MLIEWLPRIGAGLMLIIGLVGFFKPRAFTEGMQIALNSNVAMSEARTVFGGLHIGGSLMALALHTPPVYMTLGTAWFFGLLARFYSMFADGSTLKESVPGIAVDTVMAGLLLSGFFL
ncbi:MAG: DUF4345 family protein [Halieaceae bacterium]|jgi:hypothetical protein|nr:DUF4345 family protein [Halieaceae bacterium]